MKQQMHRDKLFFRIAIVLFAFLFLYVIVRACMLEPLNDEALTFLYYLETGRITGVDAFPDANNHLLNSYFGSFIYRNVGTNFFLFRLLSIAGFALYFWGVYFLVKHFKDNWYRILVLLGITSIPYVLEYFGYARGYGFAMGCFVWMVYFSIQLQKEFSFKYLVLAYLCMYLTVFSNFSMLNSSKWF